MTFGNLKPEPDPCGTISNNKHFHHQVHKVNETDMEKKVNKNHFRSTPAYPAEFKRMNVRHHTSITANMNNLINFNPTSKGLTYFEEHDTNKILHYQLSRPRFDAVIMRETEIVDKIDDMKKAGTHYHAYPQHSHRLTKRRI